MTTKREVQDLHDLCSKIEAGYDASKSGLDDDMVQLLVDLSYQTELIRNLACSKLAQMESRDADPA